MNFFGSLQAMSMKDKKIMDIFVDGIKKLGMGSAI